MKKIKSTLAVLGLLVLGFASCKKDDDKTVREDVVSSKMTFKLDGTSKTSTILVAAVDEENEDGLGISGNLGNGETLTIVFSELDGAREYDLEEDDVALVYANGTAANNVYSAESGKVKITSITNSEVKGTFQAVVTNIQDASKTVTEGKFDAKILND